ncbi:WavE lipopolysaccharide synthesis family protein [uncultured Enterovirga sp.]|uniref:WavE lipopolysaccharide synthesis family protein n=1 Tax=uncultured Enterovirga sp. TaxID=2026352 RepID=UPI0035CC72E8
MVDVDCASWIASLDKVGGLSIVIQGSLYDWNIVETANHCLHWRTLFPHAQILLSIAVTDVVTGDRDPRGVLTGLSLSPARRPDGLLHSALRQIENACDEVILSVGALPLPPIKFDNKTNNINLMIVAAQAGLARATGAYTLRVRNDLFFQDREFLTFYHENVDRPRAGPNAVAQRVMISQFFTLNPFTLERLPFHFSDWFHFGLTADIRAMWDIGFMSLSDATYYLAHDHAPGSNVYERRVRVRIAVEQHVAFSFLRAKFPDIRLDYHNDWTSRERSMRILLDDFLVCDMVRCKVIIEKYDRAFSDPRIDLQCISYTEWLRLTLMTRDTRFADVFSKQARYAQVHLLIREEPGLRWLKLTINAGKFLLGQARRLFDPVRRLMATAGLRAMDTPLPGDTRNERTPRPSRAHTRRLAPKPPQATQATQATQVTPSGLKLRSSRGAP